MANKPAITYQKLDYPRQIRLDTTTNCNAKCVSCHRFKSNKKRSGTMDIKFAREIIDDVSSWSKPLVELVPVNYGEILLYEDWYELLDYAQNKLPQTQIVIPTNGSLIKKNMDWLVKIKTIKIINFSINAYLSSTYTAFTGLPFTTINSIIQSVSLLRLKRPDITVHASMVFDPTYQSDKERDLFIEHWKHMANVQILPAANCGRHTQLIKHNLPCRSIFSDLVIGFDGRISSCCFDSKFELELGYYNGSAFDSWNSEELENLRDAHNKGLRESIPMCRDCSFA